MQLSDRIIEIFKAMNQIPRKSKHEEQISAWLEARGKSDGFDVERDSANNIIMRVPATPGYETAPILVLQGHMDMVCEKNADSNHDFSKDPIDVLIDDGWMHARETTLGADDGIGVATALALAEDKSIEHPALELFFTVDEETGMTGAIAFDPASIKGRVLLNLDSEDEGVFTVGSAGGRETKSAVPLHRSAVPAGFRSVELCVSGFYGGHSGCEIHCGRASAIKTAARLADLVLAAVPDARLVSIAGGSAHNAIPREARLTVAVSAKDSAKIVDIANKLDKNIKAEFKKTDPNGKIETHVEDFIGDAYDTSSLRTVADLLLVYPHGISAMSQDVAGLVETSCNLASVCIKDDALHILSSQRSSIPSRLDTITSRIVSAVRMAGGQANPNEGYPAWQPNMESDVLKRCIASYHKLFGHEPKIEIIHAGLECSIIGSKIPDMEMISFGATVVSPHTPSERCDVKTIGMVADFIVDLMKSYK